MSFTTAGAASLPPQLAKIVAHSSHLLTAFIQLRERYALLHPMLFVEHVPKQYGSGRQARGFAILKSSLFLSCCQDIAKLVTDNHDTTPSIQRLMEKLRDTGVRYQFRKRHIESSRWSFAEPSTDPSMDEVYRAMALQEEDRYGKEFDRGYDEACLIWTTLQASPLLKDFRTIRDKITAHTELRLHNDAYKPIDIGTLGITWGDLKRTIDSMQQLVEHLGRITRDASFAWDHLDRMLATAGGDFWLNRDPLV
jgi:AbiU2